MSYFICPCGTQSRLFGSQDSIIALSNSFNVKLLASIPLLPQVSNSSDKGSPIVISQPDHEVSLIFHSLAKNILQKL